MDGASLILNLEQALKPHGMILRGGFQLEPDAAGDVPECAPGKPTRSLVLVGNAGPEMYRHFFAAAKSEKHPLDTWTRERLEPIAARFGARAVFPFGGPPWFPFQRWAMRAEGLKSSPLGVLIHPEFGLWHAYRAAFLFDAPVDYAVARSLPFACESCRDKPCLSACPAGAITERGYDVVACATHVAGLAGSTCREQGCLARRACPVGTAFTYPAKAMEFHMAAFLDGRAPA